MRVGIVILPDQRWAQAARRWRLADEFGFDSAWTYDHIGWRDLVDGPWFDAVPVLTAAASVTSRIRLGTMVASPNFRHPVHFAREVTALDDISDGRLTVGLGAGGVGYDAAVLGLPDLSPRQRVDRFTEFVTLLDRLLCAGRADVAGQYYDAVDARSTPGCVQRPRAPFVVAANGARSMRLAARFGQGWVTTGERCDDLDAWWRSVVELTERFGEAEAHAGRGPGEVDRLLSLDAAPVFSLSSAGFFAEAVGRASELGFTDVITHWPRADSWYAGSETVLEAVASEVLPVIRKLPRPATP
ncbi:LLM class flavin-dependent oxidoreductase [Dactylosporangium darangshiense]|uniref:LLM class flavin-dependent oxidoreductase n=1 Tax=Dactylosporangium darangshiense TaxID=579108 RepID=A0ABP8DS24_9ACTN